MNQTTLYLVRHGTTDYNAAMRQQGQIDIPLNDLGLAQGRLLTDYFKDIHIDVGVTSPLTRARQTLDFMLEGHGDVPVVIEPGIIEINVGDTEERKFSECNVFFPDLMPAMNNNPGAFQAPGGESGPEVYNRMSAAVMKILRAYPGKTIAMAGHGFAIQTFLNFVEGNPAEHMVPCVPDNVAVSKFTYDPDTDKVTADYVNDHHHLTEDYRQNYDWAKLAKPIPLLLFYAKCSTCQRARAFLDHNGVNYQSRDLVADRLKVSELTALMNRLELPLRRFFNTSGKAYRERGLKDQVGAMDIGAAAACLAEDGMLVKRPILALPDRVILGFNAEKWAAFLNL